MSDNRRKDLNEIIEGEEVFEDIFETQVQEFMEKHAYLIKEELNIFKMAKAIEDRYKFVTGKAKERSQERINKVKEQNKIFYQTLMNERKQILEKEMKNIERDIEKATKEYILYEKQQEEEQNKIFDKKKEELIEKIIKIIGLDVI